jgi:hypothetical protein
MREMDEEELQSLSMVGQAVATIALQNSVDAINAVFGPGSAKLDTPLVAAAFVAQSQFLSGMIAAASMSLGDGDLDLDLDDDLDFELNS